MTKRLSNIDLGGIGRILNIALPTSDTDAASRGYVLSEIQKAIAGLDYQSDVLGTQTDATLDPGATPTLGDRYIITNSSTLHANFGVISGLENNDIVEYNGSAFVVAYDVSVEGPGALVFNRSGAGEWNRYEVTGWIYGGFSSVNNGTGLENVSGTFNVLFDNVTIGVDGNGKLFVKDDSITKAKIASDVAGQGLEQDVDGSLKVKLDGPSLTLGANGLKVTNVGLQKYAANIGDGVATEITVTHNLGSEDVIPSIKSTTAPKEFVETTVEVVDANNIKYIFLAPPTAGQYRVVVIG